LKSISGLSVVGSVFKTASAASTSRVSVSNARRTVEQTVDKASTKDGFSSWRGATVGKQTTFQARSTARALNYVPTAYVFTVQKRGEDVGYVTVGARADWSDVIEYSTATPPQRLIAGTVALIRAKDARPTGRLLYHGGVKYGVELEDGRAVNVRSGRPDPVAGIDPGSVAENSSRKDGVCGNSSTTSSSHEYLSNVPAWTEEDDDDSWNEWDGCAPIAGSMIMAYHESVGLNKKEEYIDDMHRVMKTNPAGETIPYEMDDGFDKFDTGSNSYNGRSIYAWAHPAFLKQEINAGRPFLLNITSGDQADDRTQKYGDHTVCVAGFDEDGEEFILHDTWDGTTHHFDLR
jgi:hypothetical protein